MTATNLTEVLTRLDRLEQQNRWYRRLALIVVLLASTGLLMAAQNASGKKSSSVEANPVSLRDDDGNERGYLKATSSGLVLVYTGGGGPRSGLVLTTDGLFFQMLDETGKPLTGLSMQANGICLGYRSSQDGVEVGNNAIRAVLGLSLQPQPLLARQRQ